jgi:acyl carrier protein|tara:strand:+ start:312 stop:611 length:300 start_codon:yes stop_codon:yes gene_type:complete
MKIEQKIEQIIYKIIGEKNNELNLSMEKSLKTNIVGGKSQLDSLGVFSFVLELEKIIENEFKIDLTLINDDFINDSSNHLDNVKKLKLFLIKEVSKKTV